MTSKQGLFIPGDDLPPEIWKIFFQICEVNGLTPREMIAKMILGEVRELQNMRKPLLDQIFIKAGALLENKLKYNK